MIPRFQVQHIVQDCAFGVRPMMEVLPYVQVLVSYSVHSYLDMLKEQPSTGMSVPSRWPGLHLLRFIFVGHDVDYLRSKSEPSYRS